MKWLPSIIFVVVLVSSFSYYFVISQKNDKIFENMRQELLTKQAK